VVEISPESVTAKFKDVVHAKNARKLSSVDASDLLVYTDKAAFDRKDEPLKASGRLVELGTHEDEALIVVVPGPVTLLDSIQG